MSGCVSCGLSRMLGWGLTDSGKLSKDTGNHGVEDPLPPYRHFPHYRPIALRWPNETLLLPLPSNVIDVCLDDVPVLAIVVQLHHGAESCFSHALPNQISRRLGKPLQGKSDKDGGNGGNSEGEPPGERVGRCIGDIRSGIADPGELIRILTVQLGTWDSPR